MATPALSGHAATTEWATIWAASGAMSLSGRPEGPPLPVPVALVERCTVLAAALAARGGPEIDGPALLAERAALGGLSRRGTISCGGGARLLRTDDGWIAVSLARETDRASVPAWLEIDAATTDVDDLWSIVAATAGASRAEWLVERSTLLGIPCSRLGETGACTPGPRLTTWERASAPRPVAGALVVDLSSMWAGPLCAQLLGEAGARVVKVESVRRPDGARAGDPEFFDLLHGGHESVALDFTDPSDAAVLRALVGAADVVIEASRPRALEQLGLQPTSRTKAWVRITGHGSAGKGSKRVAFGDDAAVAGGLVTADANGPCFCVDAVADPLTGLEAAVAAHDALRAPGRHVIDLSLAGVAASVSRGPLLAEWHSAIAPPRHRRIEQRAHALGADTENIVRELLRT